MKNIAVIILIIIFSDDLISEMEKNEENGILISEVKMNCKDS